jgi:TonB family protein
MTTRPRYSGTDGTALAPAAEWQYPRTQRMTTETAILISALTVASCGSASTAKTPEPDRVGVSAPCADRSAIARKEWKFAAFFNEVNCRTREVLACPIASGQASDPRASGARWDALLDVVLESDGALRAVTLAATSGRQDVDRAAIEAVKRAAPFSAPPPALLHSDKSLPLRLGLECPPSPTRS